MENNITEQEVVQEEIIQEETTQQPNEVANKEKPSVVCDKSTEPVGYGAFFGFMLLFAIPVIGWLACAICMFAPKKKSLKNYARAYMTRLILRLAILIFIISTIVNIIGNMVLPDINNALGTQFEDIGEIVEIAGDVVSGNYTDVIETIKPQLIDALGEEIEPILNEVSDDKYNELITQIINGEYGAALADFNAGRYTELQDVLGTEVYGDLISELESATKGEPTVFDEFREMIPSLDLQSLMNGESVGAFNETENLVVQNQQSGVEVAVIS